MKILIDTNVVLDLLLEREPFVETAIDLFDRIEQGELEGAIITRDRKDFIGSHLPIYSPTELLNQL